MKTNDPIKIIKEYIEKAEEQELYGEIIITFKKGEMVAISETKKYLISK